MFCEKCGSVIQNDAVFCSSCGASLRTAPTVQVQKKSSRKRKLWIVLGAMFVLGVVIFAAASLANQVPTGTPATFGYFYVSGSDSNGYKVTYELQDSSQSVIAASGTVKLVITDSSGAQQYLVRTYQVTPSNFTTYQFIQSGATFLGDSWLIPANSFQPQTNGLSQFGMAKITFIRSDGVPFSDSDSLVSLA